jgi:hypothetical protein
MSKAQAEPVAVDDAFFAALARGVPKGAAKGAAKAPSTEPEHTSDVELAEPAESLATEDWVYGGITFPEPGVVFREGMRRAVRAVAMFSPIEQLYGFALRLAFLIDCAEDATSANDDERRAAVRRLNNYASYSAQPTDSEFARAARRANADGFPDAAAAYMEAVTARFWSGPHGPTTTPPDGSKSAS